MSDRYDAFPGLTTDRPDDGVLRITMDAPGLNAVIRRSTASWPTCGSRSTAIRDVRVALVAGADGLLGRRAASTIDDLTMATTRSRTRVSARGARPRLQRHQLLEADRVGHPRARGRRGLVAALLADVSVVGRTARIIDGHTRLGVAAGDHAAICWPLLCGMAKAKYYLLTCETLTGEEAERIGLVSLCVDDDDVQTTGAGGRRRSSPRARSPRSAGRSTRSTTGTGRWVRRSTPSLAYEFYGFGGPDAREGPGEPHRETAAAVRGTCR